MTKRNSKSQTSNQIKRHNKRRRRKETNKKIKKKTHRNDSKRINKKHERKKNKESSSLSSLNSSERKGNKIYLPSELLSLAISKLDRKFSLTNLQEAIKIYDINEEINFEYLSKCGKIDKNNFKYIYTLSFEKRKILMGKYNNIDGKIFGQESKIFFSKLISFLLNVFKVGEEKSRCDLEDYKLENFEKFIIPIKEGTNELKYYYFSNIILEWFYNPKKQKSAKNFLTVFKVFFSSRTNFNKIEEIFYVIFRIDSMLMNRIKENTILNKVKYSVEEKAEDKIQKLQLIKNEIIENIDNMKITNRTELTLEENNLKFTPFYYSYKGFDHDIHILDNIENKNFMSYSYFKDNKFNYFKNDEIKNAFIDYVNDILSSNVIKEYYQKVKSFKDYQFPFENTKILNYLWKKLMFIDLDDDSWGITNREGFGIFINRDKGNNTYGLGYGAHLITVSHEFIGHYLRYIINSNNQMKAGTKTPDDGFINKGDNTKTIEYDDGGDKFESLIFDKKVSRLFIGGNHFLFNIKNWNLSLKKFKEGFIKNNDLKKVNKLKRELLELQNNDDRIRILFQNINYDNVTETNDSQSISTRAINKGDIQYLNMEGKR